MAMAGAGVGAEAGLGPGAALDTTNLYRAVTQAELDDIQGRFRIPLGGNESKFFSPRP